MSTFPSARALAALSVTLLLACGGDAGDGSDDDVDGVDATAPGDSMPAADAAPTTDATPLYPRLYGFVPTVTARATCDARNDGTDVCCADYDFVVRMRNDMATQITRITNIEVQANGIVADTGAINCADAPWTLAPGEESVEDIHIGFKYKGGDDVPELTYACGDDTVTLEVPGSILPDGDAPVSGTALLTIEGARQSGLWSSYITDQLVDASTACE